MTRNRLTLILSSDQGDVAAGEIADRLDLRFGALFRSLARRRGPQHHDILAQDRYQFGAVRHLLVAARDREAGDELRHGVLDLDPGVHLHEEVVARRRQQPLDRSGGAVIRRPRSVDGDLADAPAQRLVHGGGRRFLDELLMAALDRAVPFAEKEHVPVVVGEDLCLDVSRAFEVALDVDGIVGEELQPLALRSLECSRNPDASDTSSMPLPPPPAAALMISG